LCKNLGAFEILFPAGTVGIKNFYCPPDARNGLCNLQDIPDSADDRLSVFSTFSSLPGKGPGLILEPMWSGDEATGERYLQ
jgi:hypothetical protein